ncbi:hypothetical protein [Ferrovum myxofaciens]|uniref:hypothetical protein n=1 Tax=Ferrovum myxofaciens TaxID=416213 RepID=UPI003EBBA799
MSKPGGKRVGGQSFRGFATIEQLHNFIVTEAVGCQALRARRKGSGLFEIGQCGLMVALFQQKFTVKVIGSM